MHAIGQKARGGMDAGDTGAVSVLRLREKQRVMKAVVCGHARGE
jgi:hypothetical protein